MKEKTERRQRYLEEYYVNKKELLKHRRAGLADEQFLDSQYSDDFGIIIQHTFPYTALLSKNLFRAFRKGGFGMYTSNESAQVIDDLGADLTEKLLLSRTKFYQNKVTIAIHVEKPNASSDAINFIDVISDVVKKIIGVDDKWFEVHAVSWTINRDKPAIHLTIAQEKRWMFDSVICSNCGTPFPIADLTDVAKRRLVNTGKASPTSKRCLRCRGSTV